MAIKRRKSFFFDDEFGGDAFEAMRREMDEMLKNFGGLDFDEIDLQNLPSDGEPKVYGFSYRVGEDGKPVVQEFGNVKRGSGKNEKQREPLVDVIKSDCEITVIAELPGASKDEVRVRSTEDALSIEAEGAGERKYSKTIKLPAKVRKGSARASFKNGILEVKLALAEPEKEKKKNQQPKVCGDEVKID